jgi:SSS family solute:Na+ symporter
MIATFSTLDYFVFSVYCVVILFTGVFISFKRRKGKEGQSVQDYFLAGNTLTWWAVGSSLIAANISAEHFIAMSGSGYALGLAIAAYEWIAAIALIIVAKYFLPIFLEKKIYTMPQFIQMRFNKTTATFFAVFWLFVYVFVNMTSVSYLGALALNSIMGVPLIWGIVGLLAFSGLYSVLGGLSAVAWTDVIQVIFLIGGGLLTTYFALEILGGGSVVSGFIETYNKAGSHFHMIISKGSIFVPDGFGGEKDAFLDLPGLAVIFGAMWLTNFGYWGFNQYIIQKGLAAKSLGEAKKGLLFASFLKILIPLLVVIPGITALVLLKDYGAELPDMLGKSMSEIGTIGKSDEAYPWLLKNFVPSGIRGLAFAALVAAIVSSLASMINIYRNLRPNSSDKVLVFIGRLVGVIAIFIAGLAAPALRNLDQVFQYIQEYTGFIYPGAVCVFGMGLFWKQITSRAALVTAIATIPIGIFIKTILFEIPWILRMGYVFIILCTIASIISFKDKEFKIKNEEGVVPLNKGLRVSYILGILGLIALLVGVFGAVPYAHLALESIFMMAFLLLMLGIITYTNVKMEVMDHKAIVIKNKTLFDTSISFNIGAIASIGTVVGLYIIFW